MWTIDVTKSNVTMNWVYGPQGFNDTGIYGNATEQIPRARSGALTWSDNDGIFWMFGGDGFDSNGSYSKIDFYNGMKKKLSLISEIPTKILEIFVKFS